MSDQPTKRPTLTSRVEQVEESIADYRSQLNRLCKFRDDHRKGLQRLSRQSKVTTVRVDDLDQTTTEHGRRLARLEETLEQQKGRQQILGEHMTDAQAEAIAKELARLDGQAKAFSGDLQGQIDTLKQRVDELQETVEMQGPEIARAHDRLDDVETAPMLDIDPRTTSIELDGNVKSKAPWVKGIIVGAILGLLVFFLYTPTVDNWDTAIQVAFSILAGLAAVLIVASVETFQLSLNGRLLWGRHERQRQEELNQTTVIPAVMPDDAPQAPNDQPAADKTQDKQEVNA